jgi:ribonuclease HI
MKWARADFRGQQVWAEVDEAGAPVVSGGRRAIRYSDGEGAKLYRAGAADVHDRGGVARTLPEGVAATPSTGGAERPSARGGRGSGFGSANTRTAGQAGAAAADARARIAALPPETVLAFTDGACTGNPGPAGSGVVVRLPDGRVIEASRALGRATNNIGELTAIDMALEVLEREGVATDARVAVFTDSTYAIGVLTKGWKAKANVELIADLKARLRAWRNAEVHWVAGHVGVAENERADALAREGVEQSRRGGR